MEAPAVRKVVSTQSLGKTGTKKEYTFNPRDVTALIRWSKKAAARITSLEETAKMCNGLFSDIHDRWNQPPEVITRAAIGIAETNIVIESIGENYENNV